MVSTGMFVRGREQGVRLCGGGFHGVPVGKIKTDMYAGH